MEQWTGSQLGKEYVKAVYCHPAYSTNMQTTSCKILSWTNHKVELRWLGEISTTSDVQMANTLMAESEVDVFLEFPFFFCDPTDVGNLISGSSAFSKSSWNIWKFTVHVQLKPGLENFEHYFASVWD